MENQLLLLLNSVQSSPPKMSYQQIKQQTHPVELRPGQAQLKDQLYQKIKQGKTENKNRFLVVAPCAWGKTVFAISIMQDILIKNKKALFIFPYTCLIEQTLETLKRYKITAGIIAGEYPESRQEPLQLAMIQTLERRDIFSWFNPDVIIVDECHITSWRTWHKKVFPILNNDGKPLTILDFANELKTLNIETLESATWQNIKQQRKELALKYHPDKQGDLEIMKAINAAFSTLKLHKDKFLQTDKSIKLKSNPILIGLTATPWRLQKREQFNHIFQEQITAPTPGEMVEQNLLTPCLYYGLPEIDLKRVKIQGGEYEVESLETESLIVVNSLIENYKKICPDKIFIAYACSHTHAVMITNEFNGHDIPVILITSNTPTPEREIAYKQLATRQIKGIVSIDCLNVGFNVIEVEAILIARATKSKSLYIQQVGRGMRLAPNKKQCLVLDQTGNTLRFGFIEDITYPDLHKEQTIEFTPKLKVCPQCSIMIDAKATACPHCDYIFEKEKKEVTALTIKQKGKRLAIGELELLLNDHQKKLFIEYRKLRRQNYLNNRNPAQAIYQVIKNNPNIPKKYLWIPSEWAQAAIFGPTPSRQDKAIYLMWLKNYAKTHNKESQWIQQMYDLEFLT